MIQTHADATRVPSADPQSAAATEFDIAIVGAGILGPALAYGLAESGRSVLLLERDLSEPDRIVGELLQPGGCLALQKLGIDDALEGIDAVPCGGYQVFWGDQSVAIPYPEESKKMIWSDGTERKQEGRSFHHGHFVQNLRRKAQSAKGVTLVEATVNELIEDAAGTIVGIKATPRKRDTDDATSDPVQLDFRAKLTIVADGCMSKFRRSLLPSHVTPSTRSHFVGLVLEDADLPAPHHGHVILGKMDPANPPPPADLNVPSLGPVLVYQLATHETRMLVDVRGHKLPPQRDLASFLRTHVTPVLPSSIVPSFEKALEKSLSGDKAYRLRSMPNSWLPSYPQGRDVQGAFLAGDSLNMRHPLTGGGMTVAFNDAVILTQLLGGGKAVGQVEPDERGVVDLENWLDMSERLEEWHWKRKAVASCINVLSLALYSLFGADDENLEVLKTGCFKYFERGGDCISGPVSLLSALRPSPALLFYHFFRVAFYSIYCLFTTPTRSSTSSTPAEKPAVWDYPALTAKSIRVFWTACVVLLPVLWSEGQM
ncbi:Squalene monooxygenase [Rhodotorula toruloides]|uniref:Squalene monooxygenase n=1 Tax=Rhodotorula toruloides TaxID=5286 RepID=A0A0K3CH94_RHOTO|nr:Squalene monooxygenase [Rhodotorula toruloides]PRQ75672.1 Squalene epoxidase-domain containing protein [Rhodotorula toruloides]